MRLFKGKFMRFMAGPRSIGNVIQNFECKGNYDPELSQVNFAVSDANVLKSLENGNIAPIKPGIIEETLKALSQTQSTVKLCVDRKKNARGRGKEMGDIYCWGYERSPTLKEKKR